MDARPQCVICGDHKCIGNHYGVRSCASCREFFRRRHRDPSTCTQGGACNVNTRSRTTCPPCRLQKCLIAGMRPTPVASSSLAADVQPTPGSSPFDTLPTQTSPDRPPDTQHPQTTPGRPPHTQPPLPTPVPPPDTQPPQSTPSRHPVSQHPQPTPGSPPDDPPSQSIPVLAQSSQPLPTPRDTQPPLCFICDTRNRRKHTVICSACERTAHLSCVGLTRQQASTLPIWHCQECHRRSIQTDDVNNAVPDLETAPDDFAGTLANLKQRSRVPQHIPRRHRHRAATELSNLIDAATEQQSAIAWWRMLSYAYVGLHDKTAPPDAETTRPRDRRTPPADTHEENQQTDSSDALARRIKSKCADGDVRGALRLLTTCDSVVTPTADVIASLRHKHPPSPQDENVADLDSHSTPNPLPLAVTEEDVLAAIQSMPPGSSAGLDGIRPLHLRQLTSKKTAEAGSRLLSSLTTLCHCAITGNIPAAAKNAFFGARLIAIRKKDGGIRPIAIGSVYRRLACKLVAHRMTTAVASQLRPRQLGVGAQLGCEAAVHAVRGYVSQPRDDNQVLVKLDLSNAFNSVHREAVLRQALLRYPAAKHLITQAYAQPTPLYIAGSVIWSCRGVQQGDPLGPLLPALAIVPIIQALRSPLNVWYLDDGTLAGPEETVQADIATLIPAFQRIGLTVNQDKCELVRLGNATAPEGARINGTTSNSDSTGPITHDVELTAESSATNILPDRQGTPFPVLPSARLTPLGELSLLGAPICNDSMPKAIRSAFDTTARLIERTKKIGSHAALFFLSRYASVPRCTYLMRAAPTYTATHHLRIIDEAMRAAITLACNVSLTDDGWTQASLPVRLGGIGVRRMEDVALPAYISSMLATQTLVRQINSCTRNDDPVLLTAAQNTFTDTQCPDYTFEASNEGTPTSQRQLDEAASRTRLETLLLKCNQVHRSRLLSAAEPYSGAWLGALPVERLGMLLPDDAVRIAVALRLGAPVTLPHRCKCGATADSLGHHQLSCHRDPGRLPRHAAINDVIRRGLAAAGVPALLEPRGLDRGDGRRPDGVTIYPFSGGLSLLWDVTCSNTFGSTHVNNCAINPGAAARDAEQRKRTRYEALAQRYRFEPLAVETTGVLGPAFLKLTQELGRRITELTGEPRETCWLRQRISLAVVRGNAAAITTPPPWPSSCTPPTVRTC